MTPCTYILLAGLPGTGKSTLAAALSARLSRSIVLNKDIVREALFPGAATDYSDAQNSVVMEAILSAASYLRTTPESPSHIFFDGRTFSRPAHIEQIIRSADANGAAWRILHLWCADEVALSRITKSNTNHPATNRDAALYTSLKQRFEPIQQPHLSVDTGRPLGFYVDECLIYLLQALC